MSNEESSSYLAPEQLCIGLYVHLDLPWMDHPFTFSSFKIKDDEQLEKLRRLGLQQIRYSPAKSDVEPALVRAPQPAVAPPDSEPPHPVEDEATLMAKRARIAKLEAHRQAMVQCEKAFGNAAQTVRMLEKNIHARPKEVVAEADRLVDGMLDSLLTDRDIALHLMSDRAAGEEIYYHSLNVSVLSLTLAKELKLSRGDIHILGLAALLHDVGKHDVPNKILLKTDALTRAEQAVLEQHVQWSLAAAQKAGLVGPVLEVIGQHHEMCDGSGYPQRLKLAAIHPVARVLALINAFDNLCNAPNPAQSMTPHEALAYMFAQQRSKYDAPIMSTFIRCMGVYPPGSVVMLSNDAFALVVSVNSSRPLKPQVLVYEPDVPREEAIVVDLEEEADLNISKALKPSQLPRAAAEYLNPRKRQTYYFDAKDEA